MLSKKSVYLKSSPTLALVAKAKQLVAAGHDVISLTVGEPDWPTYPAAAAAGIKAIQNGFTKYTAAHGTLELRQAISDRIQNDLFLKYSANTEIAVTSGAKFAIFAALQVLCDEHDEVIIPTPYWVSYPTMTQLAGAQPKLIICEESVHFKLTAAALKKNITSKTKVFLFCSPSNPTGFIYTEDELNEIAEVLRDNPQIYIISDDMYNRLMFGKMKIAPHILKVAPDLKERTVLINGGSKAYAMTGWRIGWALGPSHVIKAISDYASQATGAPSSIAQAAALEALNSSEENIENTNVLLADRLSSALREFAEIKQFIVHRPDGAFYLWIDISSIVNKKYKNNVLGNSAEFCRILLEDYYVSTVPGEEFGHSGYMRLSFAIEKLEMSRAIERIKKLINILAD